MARYGTLMPHDPDAVLPYALDFSAWLGAGETLVSAVWSVPAGLVAEDSFLDGTATVATVVLSGGTAGTRYTVTCHVVTSAGNEDDRSLFLRCVER